MSQEPILEIGEREGDEVLQFHDVTGGRVLSDGGIAILNNGTRTIRLFADDGHFLREFGGEGDGPGEFRALNSMHVLPGDTLLLWDVRNRRVTLMGPSGQYLGSHRLNWAGGDQLLSVGPLQDHGLVVGTGASPFPEGLNSGLGIHRGMAPLLLFDRHGIFRDTIGVFPNLEAAIMQVEGQPMMTDAPFAKNFYFDVWRGSVVVGTAESMAVEVWDPVDGLSSIFRYPDLDLTVQQADRDWFWDGNLDAQSSAEEQEEIRMLLRALPFPETRAAFTDLIVDTEGNTWVRGGRSLKPYAPPTEWGVFSRSGVLLGSLSLPSRLRILEIRSDEVLGVWRDDMDVEFIRVYEILKPGEKDQE